MSLQPDQFDNVVRLEEWRQRKSRANHPSGRSAAFMGQEAPDAYAMGNPKKLLQHMVRAHGVPPKGLDDPASLVVRHREWHRTYQGSFDHEH